MSPARPCARHAWAASCLPCRCQQGRPLGRRFIPLRDPAPLRKPALTPPCATDAAATVGVVTERNAEQAIEELKAYEVGGA